MTLMHGGIAQGRPYINGKHYNAWHNGKQLWPSPAWTGTANASTSTLSQDGSVVAINHALDPSLAAQPSIAWIGKLNISWSQYDEGGVHVWRASHKAGDASGTVMVKFPMDAPRWSYSAYGLMVRTSISLNTLRLNDAINFTVPADTSKWTLIHSGQASSSNTFYSNNVLSGWEDSLDSTIDWYVEFARPLAMTATDWGAMQTLGIDWFSGDEYGKVSQ